jgi:endoglucanase
MLNATHHDWTRANISHGLAISRRVGGKHFIVNTSFNGRGPIHIHRGRRRLNIWCNPPGRGLGIEPTTITGHPLVDAYMWDQPARLFGRRAATAARCGRQLVAGARAHVRALPDELAVAAPRHEERLLPSGASGAGRSAAVAPGDDPWQGSRA